jgi:hypothetical protein
MLNLSLYFIRNSRALIACLLLFGLGKGMVESSTLLQPTDHVVFIGDSITGQGSKPGGWVGIMQAALDTT